MKTKFRKILSSVIASVITVLSWGGTVVNASDSYAVHFFNTFEDESTLSTDFKEFQSDSYGIDSVTHSEVLGLGKTLKFVSDGKKGGVDILLPTAVDVDSDTCMELEYDLSLSNAEGGISQNNQFVIAPNGVNYILYRKDIIETVNVDPKVRITTMATNEMHRYKITMQAITSNNKRVWEISSFKADGVELLAAGTTIVSDSISGDMSYIRVRFSADAVGDIAYLDNVSVTSYISTDGTSPVPDRYELLKTAQTASQAAEESFNAGIIQESVYKTIKAKADEALTLYMKKNVTTKEYDACISDLKSVEAIISAYTYMSENGISYYVDDKNPVVTGDFMTDSTVTVSMPVYTAEGEKGTELQVLGFLYNDNEDLFSPMLVDISSNTGKMDPGKVGEISVNFDLSEYANREGLSAKVVVLNDYSEITTGVPSVLTATKDDATVTDSIGFENDVNVSKAILNDNPETEEYKIVYKLKGKAGNTVSLLAVKPGAKLSDISSKSDEVIEYYNTAVFDENGKAMFEFVPQSGMDYYSYIINCDDYEKPVEDKVFYASLGDIDKIIDKIYKDKTLDNLETTEIDAISINTPVYQDAVSAGADIDGILEETLEEKDYNARLLGDFTNSFFEKLNIVTLFRQASSADRVMEILDDYSSMITNSGKIQKLSSKEKQKAYGIILSDKNSIKNIKSLNDIISDAAKEAEDDDSGSSGSYRGGTSSGGRPIVTPAVVVADNDEEGEKETAMQAAASKFSDLDSVEWAKDAIVEFAARGWINGKADGIFAPNDSITREEFVKIAVNVFGFYDEKAECGFADTSVSDWHYRYISSAASKEIVNGVSENSFGVGTTITRQDMAVIIYRIAKLCNLKLTEDGEYLPFADETLIGEYAFEAVIELTKSGVINGTDNNSFVPEGLATRAEAVKMLYAAYNLK